MGAISVFRWRRYEDVMFWVQSTTCYLGYDSCSTKGLKGMGISPPEVGNRIYVQNVLALLLKVEQWTKSGKMSLNILCSFQITLHTYIYTT
jgi:hypothetical protein